jgi:heme-degrading monooxygenase HmoA
MIGVLSKFVIANGLADEVKAAFQKRPHFVDSHPGFVRMDVLSPQDAPNEIWLLTYWQSEAEFLAWHRSHSYREAHAGIPKGLKLVPSATLLRLFDFVSG